MEQAHSEKSPEAFRTISEAAVQLDLPQHVLRFWETKFSHIKPLKRAGGRRYYRPADIENLLHIKNLLHADGYTIKGVQKLFREQGHKLPETDITQTPLINAEAPTDIVDMQQESSVSAGVDKDEILNIIAELEATKRILIAAKK